MLRSKSKTTRDSAEKSKKAIGCLKSRKILSVITKERLVNMKERCEKDKYYYRNYKPALERLFGCLYTV